MREFKENSYHGDPPLHQHPPILPSLSISAPSRFHAKNIEDGI